MIFPSRVMTKLIGCKQVMALTEGRHVETDVLASLVAAVRSSREAAGTLGIELRGATLTGLERCKHPRFTLRRARRATSHRRTQGP